MSRPLGVIVLSGFFTCWAGLALLAQAPPAAPAAPAAPTAPAAPPQTVKQAWDDLLSDVIPQAPVDPVLKVPQVPFSKRPVDDFENHFFFESRTEYIRSNIWFTGNPTVTGVINAPETLTFNPAGIPNPNSFQPSSNAIYEFMNFGTRGWLSDRLFTNFSIRYRQDLTHVDAGSPFQSPISAFNNQRRVELLTGVVELRGEAGDGVFAHSSLALGRQNTYGLGLVSFDGVTYSQQVGRATMTFFGGRRFTYFDDPVQRALAGGDLLIRLPKNGSLEYEALFYVKGSHRVTVRKALRDNLNVSSYFGWVGGHPTDFNAQAFWLPRDGKTSLHLSFFQKLSDQDYIFDFTSNVTHVDPNTLTRLNLGTYSPYSQVMADARREIKPWLRAGGTVVLRRLTSEADQAAFNDSFDDYRANLQVFPVRSIEVFMEYHLRDTHRRTPLGTVIFDDTSTAGETREQDFRVELRRAFGKGARLQVSLGGFYRNIDLQDRFFYVPNQISKGVLGSVNVRLDKHTRAYFNYSLDNDFYIFQPDIERAQVLRIGLIWKY
jgi:hypothetical protein